MNELIEETNLEDNTFRVTTSELKSYVERFETLDNQKKEIQELQKDIMSEAENIYQSDACYSYNKIKIGKKNSKYWNYIYYTQFLFNIFIYR